MWWTISYAGRAETVARGVGVGVGVEAEMRRIGIWASRVIIGRASTAPVPVRVQVRVLRTLRSN